MHRAQTDRAATDHLQRNRRRSGNPPTAAGPSARSRGPDPKDALVHPPQGLARQEAGQRLDAEAELPYLEAALGGEAALTESFEDGGWVVPGPIDDVHLLAAAAPERRLHRLLLVARQEVQRLHEHAFASLQLFSGNTGAAPAGLTCCGRFGPVRTHKSAANNLTSMRGSVAREGVPMGRLHGGPRRMHWFEAGSRRSSEGGRRRLLTLSPRRPSAPFLREDGSPCTGRARDGGARSQIPDLQRSTYE
jgi:hypothetical protein